MNNGCICCSVRQDLIETFHQMFTNELFATLDWVVIETTGMTTHLITRFLNFLQLIIRSSKPSPIDSNVIHGYKMSRIFAS